MLFAALSWIGALRFCGPGAPRSCGGPSEVALVSGARKSLSFACVSFEVPVLRSRKSEYCEDGVEVDTFGIPVPSLKRPLAVATKPAESIRFPAL